jgi:AcrR family transcriptional regulator
MATGRSAPRVRDPGRKQRILAAAADLGARRGFHAISMADIGSQAGIVGSGIYRHFDSKTGILVAMLDQVMDRISDGAATILAAGHDPAASLTLLVRDHIVVAIEDRDVLAVYHRRCWPRCVPSCRMENSGWPSMRPSAQFIRSCSSPAD